jgi:hypothetical protein
MKPERVKLVALVGVDRDRDDAARLAPSHPIEADASRPREPRQDMRRSPVATLPAAARSIEKVGTPQQ